MKVSRFIVYSYASLNKHVDMRKRLVLDDSFLVWFRGWNGKYALEGEGEGDSNMETDITCGIPIRERHTVIRKNRYGKWVLKTIDWPETIEIATGEAC